MTLLLLGHFFYLPARNPRINRDIISNVHGITYRKAKAFLGTGKAYKNVFSVKPAILTIV